MRRGIGATALVAVLALAATACGGSDSDDTKGADGEISGTVTYWDTSNDAEKGVYKKIAEDFEKKHPKVDVEYVHVNFGDANAKFKNAAGSNSGGAPDVMRTEVAWVADFANLGYLAPLDDTPALKDTGDYLDAPVGSTRFEGKTYAVPQVTDTLGLFYNEKLLDEAGVEVPTTFDELKKASLTVRRKTDAEGFYLRGDDPYWFLPYLYGEGGDMVDAENKKITVDDGGAARAFATMKDLLDSGAAISDATGGQDNGLKSFQDGDVAMMIDGPWDIAGALEGKAFSDPGNLGVAAVPGNGETQGAPQGGWNLSVYAGSENLDASYAFAAYMSSAEVQQRTTEELSLLPTRVSVYQEPSVQKDEMVQFFKPAVDKAHQRPWIPEANSLFEPIRVQMNKVLFGDTAPKAAGQKIGDEYAELLEDYK
ncbi:extracellular solute-binding protein [Streptomyces sp. TR02-1]|uniref:extracellular solute-binding protein n=1 Tax=Streptomyces sp. TR02-1 TaxID=3385977 RepID=UPI0039A33550